MVLVLLFFFTSIFEVIVTTFPFLVAVIFQVLQKATVAIFYFYLTK